MAAKTLARLAGRGAAAVAVVALGVALPATARADEIRDMQWHLGHLDMAAAWDISEGEGVTVAVIDTGVDATHPDLGDAVVAGIDLTGSGGDGTVAHDDHGTAMAGLIAARGQGQDGVRGIAPASTILPVAVSDGASSAEGMRWATDHGADVINVSGGTDLTDDPAVREAVAYALSQDVVVVASAGNNSGPRINFPGAYGGVITVSATTQQDRLTDVSSYGPEIDLAAPGDVTTIAPDGGYYQTGGGTSSATAITSGVVALVRAEFPDLDAANVVNRMIATGRDIGPAGDDDEFGFGLVDPVAALTANVPAVSENPLGSPDGESGATSEPPASEPAASEPAESEPPASSDPCPADSGAPADGGSADPAGALALDDDCDGFVGVSPGSSNNALGVVVAVGIAVVILVGVAIVVLRRRRSAPSGSSVPAYVAPGPPAAGGAPGWQQPQAQPPSPQPPSAQPPPAPGTGGWPAPPAGPPPNQGWTAPPPGGPPSP